LVRILITNFHPIGGGGHVSYIDALTRVADYSDCIVGVVSPRGSRVYQYLKARDHPYLYSCGFPGLSDSIETISFAAREMMSMGKPLISSPSSGLRENVCDGINGYLVPPGDIERTAEVMKMLLNADRDKLKKLSMATREYAISKFNIVDQIKAHISVYDRITSIANRKA
jgi:glycosyltransferase involved in cell wall biosynthesis